jgi:pimeloyl-ACP methyl ester carboxylesterase
MTPVMARELGSRDRAAARVVLVHGAMDRGSSFRRVAKHLEDLRVVVYDRRGYGDAIDIDPPTSLIVHRDDLIAVIGTEPSVVVSHSYAGHIAVLAAIARPDLVRALGVWEVPVPWTDFWPPPTRAMLEGFATTADPGEIGRQTFVMMRGADAWEQLPDDERARLRREALAYCRDIASELDQPYDFGDLRVPCLIGYGTDTWPFMQSAAAFIAASLDAPTFLIDGAAHPAHATHPEQFAAFVRATVALAFPSR